MAKKTETITVDLCPGLNKKGGPERIRKALDARNEADYQCFMLLDEMYRACGNTSEFRKMLANLLGDDAGYLIERIEEQLEARRNANEEFLQAVSGH